MEESVHIFSNICHSPFFTKTSFILFLNKIDILKEKIQYVTPGCIYEDYDGGNDYSAALKYIENKFIDTYHLAREGVEYDKDQAPDLYTTATNATCILYYINIAKDSINTAFLFCESIITKNNLIRSKVF